MWTVYGIVLDGQMDSRLAESLLMLPDAVTTLSLANVDHIKLTTIVVRVLFAVASLAHALLATVCMHAWNLLTQTAHKDPKHQPALGRVPACPFVPGKQVARLACRGETQGRCFVSNPVANDLAHVERLNNVLTTKGLSVYWD